MIKSLRLSYLRSMHVEVNMEKIAITGVLQLVGFHLCNQLLKQGVQVVGFDNFDKNKHLKTEMLLAIGRNANFHFLEWNAEKTELKHHLKDAALFFHLDEEIEVISDLNHIIEICDQLKLPIIAASSLEVYGPCQSTCDENTPLQPTTRYGKRKKLEEDYLLNDAKRCNRRIAVIRLPHIFGPWQNPNDRLHKLILQCVKTDAGFEELVNNRSLSKNYMFVNNVVDAFLLMMNHRFEREIYNLSLNDEKYCSQKIRTELSYQPKYSFQQGVEMVKKHIEKMLEINPSFFKM